LIVQNPGNAGADCRIAPNSAKLPHGVDELAEQPVRSVKTLDQNRWRSTPPTIAIAERQTHPSFIGVPAIIFAILIPMTWVSLGEA